MDRVMRLPGMTFNFESRRRDLDRIATPKQQHAINLMRSAVKKANAEVAATCAPPTHQMRPTVCLARNSAALPSTLTATPQQPRLPNLTWLTLLCLCVFTIVVGTLTAGVMIAERRVRGVAPTIDGGAVIATPATEWRDETSGR